MLEIRHTDIHDPHATMEAYNDIYSQEGILLRDSFYLWLVSLLQPEAGKLLVDISCGQGRLTVLAQNQGLRAIGVDFAYAGVSIGRAESPHSGWAVGDGERLPFEPQSVDYITHIGSLEHYMDPYAGAREIGRILKPDGRACILLPNAYGLFGNIRRVWGTGDIYDDGQPLQRYATRMNWQRMLEQGGLRIEKVIGYGEIDFPRTRQDLIYLLKKPQKILRYLISRLIPLNLTNHLVYICGRA